MTRVKKKRSSANRIEWGESPQRRSEKLADPDSYESRKKRALEKRKRQKTVYEKHLEREAQEEGRHAQERLPRGGRLAEKIRRLNRDAELDEGDEAGEAIDD